MSKKKKRIRVTAIVIGALVIIYFLLPKYVQRALIYTNVGIDDYPLFDNRTVKTAAAQPWGVNPFSTQLKLTEEQNNGMKEHQTIAYLVIKDGEILFEKYWDEYGPESITNSFSMAKSIVGLLVGAALDDGYIKSLDEPVANYVPQFNNETNKDLSIKDVLTMSSGLNWDESYGSLFNKTTEAYYGKNINDLIYGLKVVEEPGKVFKYLSGNTQVLAMVVENASKKRISDYASEKFWKPMGAVNEALWCLDDTDGMEKAYCCFNSNVRDFARWGQLILNNGVWNNDTLLSPQYVFDATHAANLTDEKGVQIDHYGYQWWIHGINDMHIPYMRGILGQYVFAIHDENAVVVRLGHKRSKTYLNDHPDDTYFYLKTGLDLINQYKQSMQ